jgi:hypothetical protein
MSTPVIIRREEGFSISRISYSPMEKKVVEEVVALPRTNGVVCHSTILSYNQAYIFI